MNKAETLAIKSQIDFEKYKNGEANKIVGFINNANKELSKFIKQTSDVASKKRYTEIARKLKDVSKKLMENVEKGYDLDGIIDYELKRQKSILNSIKPYLIKAKGGEVNFLYPTREQIKTAALFRPADTKAGLTFQSYLEGIETGLHNVWDSAVRTGYMTGMPTNEIVDYVIGKAAKPLHYAKPGVINSFVNSVYANTRTILQSFANSTREKVYEENEQYFGDKSGYKYEYLATLDSRTCLVCGNLDGKLFKSIKESPKVPLHRGCRCIVIPYFGFDDETRASKNGQISNRVKFSDWLGEQDEKTQREVLGKTRYELYKKGEAINQFIDDGRVLSLDDLAKNIQ